MTTFSDIPGILDAVIGGNRSRAVSAGIDPNEYTAVTSQLGTIADWQPHFRATGHAHLDRAREAAAAGRAITSGEGYLTAALWFHFSTTMPGPDRRGHVESADSYRMALTHLDPDAVWIAGDDVVGVLRRPRAVADPPVVIVVPGLDSSITEFHSVANALLKRGVATLSIDGPGQGELAPATAPTPDYQLVVDRAVAELDQQPGIDTTRLGVMGLSLGGYYASLALAHRPRLHAGVVISGAYQMSWSEVPPFIVDTLTLRTGSREAAQQFATRVDLAAAVGPITQPILVVDGGDDSIPGVRNGQPIAHTAPAANTCWLPAAITSSPTRDGSGSHSRPTGSPKSSKARHNRLTRHATTFCSTGD